MPTGQYTAADLAPTQTAQKGQFSAADIDPPEKPGILDKEIPLTSYGNATLSGLQSLGRGARSVYRGVKDTFGPPETDAEAAMGAIPGVLPGYRVARGVLSTAMQAREIPAAIHDINQSPDPLFEYGKAAQDTAGEGAAQAVAALATEGASKVPVGRVAGVAGKVARGIADDIPVVRQAGKIAKYWKETAPLEPAPVNPGAPLPKTPSQEFFQGRGLREGGRPGADPAAGLAQIPARGSIAESFKDPGAMLPAAPAPEVTQAAALQRGAQPVPDPSAGLGQIPVRGSIAESMKTPETTPAAQQSAAPPPAPKPSPRPVARGTLNKMMDQELGKALGAKQLDPKVPLRGQMAARMPAESDAALPEGHKPVDSSALRSYNYDAPAKEFHARATSGSTIYIYGDVSPESAAGFESAPSKGKAWQSIRQNHPLVAKIVMGKRIAVKPAAK